MSTIVRQGKLDMIHIQNSTLAGGVAIGTATTSEIGFHGAMIIGTLAGMISVLGFHFILPKVQRIRVHDTFFFGNRSGYLNHLTDVCLTGGKQLTKNIQAAYQAVALGLTLCMAIVDEPNWHLPDVGETGDTASLNKTLDRRFSMIPVANMNKNLQRRFIVFPV
ncbi:unnamed protein product [Rotaria magnacalcarata]|uniref:Ammonium transporter AmtB-like domain-containing protein n=2 Tax=Rotaria magnacalcarata TaxID=392030 RepID=A0A816LKG3_9BILA|nr:unnamed protein product [Rotaria magnacalcarata]